MADVIYVPVDGSTGEAIELEMQHLQVTGRVWPIGGLLTVVHTFKAGGSDPSEVIYPFMLPRDATLRRFRIRGEGFDKKSKLKSREKAREKYEEGVERGRLSSLAAVHKDGMVNLSVGQIRPGEEVTVSLEIVTACNVRDDSFRFRFPFTVAPSFHSKAKPFNQSIELPDDIFGDMVLPKWTRDGDKMHTVGFDLEVCPGMSVEGVSSPSHRVDVSDLDGGGKRVKMATHGDVPNRDLILSVSVSEEPTLYIDEGSYPNWTAVIPSSRFKSAKVKSRRVVFCFDKSGSMWGGPMDRAKTGVLACLSGLSKKDRFGLVRFSSQIEVFGRSLHKAKPSMVKQARGFVESTESGGGTELQSAVEESLKLLGDKGGDIVLLTDGQVWNTAPIVEMVKSRSNVRVHTLGIGSASQDRFLSALARATGALDLMVSPSEDVGSKALELSSAVRRPLARKVKIKVDGEGKIKHGPLYDKAPLTIRPTSEDESPRLKVKLKGGDKYKFKNFHEVNLPKGLNGLLWASEEITRLNAEYEIVEVPSKKLRKKLKKLSKTYGLASHVMSLVAVVKRKGDKKYKGVDPSQSIVNVGVPEGMRAAPSRGAGGQYSMDSIKVMANPPKRTYRRNKGLHVFGSRRSTNRTVTTTDVANNVTTASQTITITTSGEMKGASASSLTTLLSTNMDSDGGIFLDAVDNSLNSRIFSTLLTIRGCLEVDVHAGSTVYESHVTNMVNWLKNQLTHIDDTDKKGAVRRAIVLANKRSVEAEAWEEVISAFTSVDAHPLFDVLPREQEQDRP